MIAAAASAQPLPSRGQGRGRPQTAAAIVAIALGAAIVTSAGPAQAAFVFWTSEDGERTVELSPSLKLFVFGATGFLDAPPIWADLEPTLGEWPFPDAGGGTLGRLRLRFSADLGSRVRFVVHYEHRPRILSHSRLLSAAAGSLQGDEPVPNRITPMLWEIAGSGLEASALDELYGQASQTFVWEHEIDRLFFSFSLPGADIVVGRQAVGWGMGRLWSPLDVFAPLTATDIDREERRGIDAIKLTLPFSQTAFLEVVLAAGLHTTDDGDDEITWSASSLAWLLRWNLWGLDWMLMAGKVGPDRVVGAGLSGQIRGVGVRGEVTSTGDGDEPVTRATLGVEFGTSINLIGVIEYHYNGFGVLHTGEYLGAATALASRLVRGQVSGLARHYAGATLAYQPITELSIALVYIQNLQDGSLVLGPSIEYSISDEVRLSLSGFIPLGRDARWQTSGGLPQLRPHSEFGLSPQLYVLTLRVAI